VLWQPPETVTSPQQPGCVTITSACWSPIAGGVLALGYALPADAEPRRRLLDPTGQFHELEVVALPFYDSGKERPRGHWRMGDWIPV
jgi:glycine cleavage system aminomethyltransferase T